MTQYHNSIEEYEDAKDWLRDEFQSRLNKNSSYSLRAFSQLLTIPSGRVSEVFSGKRRITTKMAGRIADRLCLPPCERESLQELVSKRRHEEDRTNQSNSFYRQISVDTFHFISDWYHLAILNLIKTADFRVDVKWIASRLKLKPTTVNNALERLKRLDLLFSDQKNVLKRTGRALSTLPEVPNQAVQVYHRQNLEKAIEAIEEVDMQNRDFSNMTMAICPKKLPEAKIRIKKFRRELAEFLEEGADSSEVYSLSIQLFPVTRKVTK